MSKIPESAVEAAMAAYRGGDWLDHHATRVAILEAAAPHMLAGVTALADAWEARGEHDMKVSKTIKDEDIAIAILTDGATKVENARHLRNALRPTP